MAWRRVRELLLLALVLVGGGVSARQVTALDDGWRFLRADVAGAGATVFDDSVWAVVRLPHTWNGIDGEAGGAYYRGPGWYRRELQISAAALPSRHFLQFDGAALRAEIWVNGQLAGRHDGGYAAFRVDISAPLRAGRNVIAVRVDNATAKHVAPLGGDFTVFGGLYRSVKLLTVPAAHFDLLDDGGPGVYVSADDVTAERAHLSLRARVRNDGGTAGKLALHLQLRDAQGRDVAHSEQSIEAAAQATVSAEQPWTVPRPHLWQGAADPYVYTLTAELRDGATVLDTVTLPIGMRSIRIDPQRGLLLNGQPYAVHGVNLFHSGRPGHGLAVSDAQIDEDFRILDELGVTGLRFVHFQHPQRAYDDADRAGLLVLTEIPLNSAMDEGEAFRANLSQQLRELIKQNQHHPSVIVLGVGNEVYRSDAPVVDLLAQLTRETHALDPTRPTIYAHCCAADDHAMARQTDVIGFNRYYGWYDGTFADIGPWADRVHAAQPDRALSLTEYGAGASVLHQQDPPVRPQTTARFHPEQYQALFHEAYWPQIAARPWLWGSFVWVGFDLASAGRNEGDRPGINDKGLVTYDRATRKDAFLYYQAQWSAKPVLHFASRRATPRAVGPVDVKVYANGGRVTLTLNGAELPAQATRGGIAIWPGVPLQPGRNRLEARADNGATDNITWIAIP
ncbi:glycoside hydrolase family 2 TIM barrel-domain containing protein [Roseateles sp. BYS78W]|uniref:Glycoside hydrolase family 2 TIM barrel-domain containing protein n=1 Tax=Pelomonas candidula TaxID=3299025 RepID=A0ABW7HL45_9BURK